MSANNSERPDPEAGIPEDGLKNSAACPNEALSEDSAYVASDSASNIYPVDGLSYPLAVDVIYAAADDGEVASIRHEDLIPMDEFDSDLLQKEKGAAESNLDGDNATKAVASTVILTSRKELFAWWAYYFAYEPISAVVMVLLVPLLLQDLSRRVGHVLGDPNRPCLSTDGPDMVCVYTTIGKGWHVTPSAFAYYTIGLSVAAQAISFVSVGALADYGKMRKTLLIACTWMGSFCTMAMILIVRPNLVWLASILTILLNMFFGTASVFYNAYLPLLIKGHPKYLEAARRLLEQQHVHNPNSSGHANVNLRRKLNKAGERLSNFVSTVGAAAGYLGGIIVILLVMGYFFVHGTDGLAVQGAISCCGTWWFVFSLYSLWKLKYRPGPELPIKKKPSDQSQSALQSAHNVYLHVTFSWRKLARTVKKCRRLPTTFAFLMCYLFFSDGYGTMASAALLIARQSMDVSMQKLTLCALIAPVAALIGTFAFLFIQRALKISSRSMLLVLLSLLGTVPLYCCIGLFSQRLGLRQEWEIYALTSFYGFLVGATQSFSRVLFSELIPVGEESEFFSLYAVTDKGSAVLGPIVIALLSDYTNEPRYGLLFLAALILAPVPFLIKYVSIQQGKQECAQFVLQREQRRLNLEATSLLK